MGRKKTNHAFSLPTATRDAKGNAISGTVSTNTIVKKPQDASKSEDNYKKYDKKPKKQQQHVFKEFNKVCLDYPVNRNFVYEEITGDLFDSPEDAALVHCVAEDMHMNAGIAIEFRKRFSSTGDLLDQGKKSGQMAFITKKGRSVYYLVTKRTSQSKPTIMSIEQCLIEMMEHVKTHNIKKIAMPTIGCGLDRLNWEEVKELIKKIFQHLDVHIIVYIFKKTAESMDRVKGSASSVHKISIKDMERNGTLFAYLAGEDSLYITEELQNFDQWKAIKMQEKTKTLTRGQLVRMKVFKQEYVALVCLDKDGEICYKDLENCMKELKKEKLDGISYMGIETLTRDELDVKKLESVIRFSKEQKIDIWICCPNLLQ